MEYTDNNGNKFDYEKLLPCPFCGVVPIITFIGNNYTKSRRVTIKCKGCRAERTDAAIFQDHVWVAMVAIDHWNKRVQ